MSAEEAPAPRPNLTDILAMVEALGSNPRMGRTFRKTALALADTDPNQLEGLLIDGDVHDLSDAHWEYAACGCRDGRHRFTRDSPFFGRSYYQTTRSDAEALIPRGHGHLLRRLVATTPLEVIT